MFSELVDRRVHTAGRPDALADLAYFANETMRDLSKRNDWPDDSLGEMVAVPGDTRQVIWEPTTDGRPFRREEYVVDGCGCSPKAVKPSARIGRELGGFYYRSGQSFVFQNVCHPVRIYYYAYQRWLYYFPRGERPAEFNVINADWGGALAADIAKVSNWMLERHNHVVYNGTLARFFASKQDPRQSVHYSAYEQGISHMIRAEGIQELVNRR